MKLHLFKNPDQPIFYYDTQTVVEVPNTIKNHKPFRAMWVSNVANIDFPVLENIEDYQQKIITMLDTAKSYHLNAIFYQVRTTNDAFYTSKLNPYSRYLTGTEGKKPLFDVLKFVIDEAKKRNIEVHAWCNPYRVSLNGLIKKDDYLKTCDPMNLAVKRPDLIILNKEGQIILNPAKPEVRQHIIDSMLEIIDGYDVAGIHFDDYFYPYQGLDEHQNDLPDYEQRTDINQSLDDFRRQQVSLVIEGLYKAIKAHKPAIRFGVSPFGIWRNHQATPEGAHVSPKATQSYDNQYADAYLWVKSGYIDYIVPQLYWEFGHPLAPYADLVKFWVKTCQHTKVDLYLGHGAYRLGNEGEYENPREVTNQLLYANPYKTVKGHVFFTYKTFINQDKSKLGMAMLKNTLKEVAK